MPLHSVATYVQTQLNGLVSPGLPAATAYISPPIPGDASLPVIYIWGSRIKEARWTMPRATFPVASTGGFKRLEHDMSVWVYLAADPNTPNLEAKFSALVDAIMSTLRFTVPLNGAILITDDLTGLTSNIVEIGETMELIYGVPKTGDESTVWWSAQVTLHVVEQLQG